MRRILVVFAMMALLVPLVAGERGPVKPQPRDKCPVCGMFVQKYPDFLAEIIFRDGSYVVFDGAKDMFKYYFDMAKYGGGKRAGDIEAIYVTDYYELKLVDARKALYVDRSNVFGPMGKELIPFAKEADAKQFIADHNGRAAQSFERVLPELVRSLD